MTEHRRVSSDNFICSPLEEEPFLVPLLIQRGADELKTLGELKRKGWAEQNLDEHFRIQRGNADNPSQFLSRHWFYKMKGVLKEVDTTAECILGDGGLRFLDLGCCPGGFSSHILDKNIHAKGVGISLETAKGGHQYLLENHHRHRHQILYRNLTLFQLGPTEIKGKGLRVVPFDIMNRCYDLALLDGHQLRTQTCTAPWDRQRLAISQVVLALLAVKAGGVIIMKLSRPETSYASKLLYMLDILSLSLSVCKPRSMHTTRGTFYAVAKGVGLGMGSWRLPQIRESFQQLWVELTYGGEEGRGRFMTETDLDFVISTDAVAEKYLDRLVELGHDVWATQAEALKGFLNKKGIL